MEILQSNVSLLKEKADSLKNLDSCILELLCNERSSNLEKEIEETSEFERHITDTIRMAEKILKPEEAKAKEQRQGSSGRSVPLRVRNSSAKLPKLFIKRYSGDPKGWQSFWDSFSSAVHTNASLNEVDKFNYLRSLLEGAVLASVSGLSLTESNYKSAVEILTERFGNKQLSISSHMEALLQLPAVTVITDIKRIRMISDKVAANVRGLEALGIASDTYGSLLVPVMMNKLPEELRLIIIRHFEAGIWHLNKLLKSFKEEVQARERCSFMSRPNERGSESEKP